MRIQIAFSLFQNGIGDYFTLDDSTKGVLDNTTYVLAGDVLVDVTSDVRAIQIRRGRNRQLQRFTAGAANVRLSNRDRKYDPLNTSSPYSGSIVPGKQVIIDHLGYPLYSGFVADWNLDYDLGGDNTAEMSCTDGFAQIAGQVLSLTTTTSQLTGARINAALDNIAWPSTTRSISTGAATLGADTIPANTSALAYIQDVGDVSEPGAVFMSRDGKVTFKDRTDLQAASGVVFGTGGIPFVDIGVIYGSEELFNSYTVTYTGGTVSATNDASVSAYGTRSDQVDTLLSNATQASKLATWLVNKYGNPVYRIGSIRVALHGLSSADAIAVVGLELGQTVTVTWTPGGVGAPLTQYLNIEGIQHEVRPDEHFVSFTLSQTFAAFVVGSSQFGVIGSNLIGW